MIQPIDGDDSLLLLIWVSTHWSYAQRGHWRRVAVTYTLRQRSVNITYTVQMIIAFKAFRLSVTSFNRIWYLRFSVANVKSFFFDGSIFFITGCCQPAPVFGNSDKIWNYQKQIKNIIIQTLSWQLQTHQKRQQNPKFWNNMLTIIQYLIFIFIDEM